MQIDARTLAGAVRSDGIGGTNFLRAIAILIVIVHHQTETQFNSVTLFAGLGVKIFFVLSGFLITDLLLSEMDQTKTIDVLGFYRRRLARLMPIFYLYLPIAIAIQFIHHREVPWGAVLASMFYVVNYYQAFTGAQTNIVSHCWSLAVQEQFYVLWPLAMLAIRRNSLNLKQVLTLAIVVVWIWRWLLLATGAAGPEYLYRALETRADDLLVGCLTAVLVRSDEWCGKLAALISAPLTLPIIVAILVASNYAATDNTVIHFGVTAVVQPPAIAALILWVIAASGEGGYLGRIVNQPLLAHIGRISYGMYIFQGLLGYTAARLVHSYTGSLWLGVLAATIVIVSVASFLSRVYETPMRRWLAGSSRRPRRVATREQLQPSVN